MKRLLALLAVSCASAPNANALSVPIAPPVSTAADGGEGGTAAAAEPPPPIAPPQGTGPNGCLRDSEYAAYVRRVEARNDALFQAAVAKAGVTPVKLTAHTWDQLGDDSLPPNPVVQRNIAGRQVQLLLIGRVLKPCGGSVEDGFYFARKGSRIFRIERHVTTRRVEVPVCPATTCPPATLHCGGALQMLGLGFELPPGTRYAGELTVQITADWVQPRADSAPGIVCPAQPKPS